MPEPATKTEQVMTLLRRHRPTAGKTRKLKRRDAYRRAAEVLGGELHEGRRPSQDKVLTVRGPWRIWLDTYTVSTGQASITYTRVRAEFRGWRNLKVTIRRRNWRDRLLGKLGLGKTPSVDRRLLEHCVVKGRPEQRAPLLFGFQELIEAALAVRSFRLNVKRAARKTRRRYGEDAGQVVCETTGVIVDVEWLVAMVRLVAVTLEGLERISEARREALPDS